jgi:hypothetical protein
VFVDDGSSDGTPDLIEELLTDVPGVPAWVLRRTHAGKGAAVAAGLVALDTPLRQWLWSPADEQVGHVRRYNRRSLRTDLAAAGFEPALLSHVFSWLVPPVWLKRKLVGGATAELGLDQTSRAVDWSSMVLTLAERTVVGRASLPFGTSVLCVATRPS